MMLVGGFFMANYIYYDYAKSKVCKVKEDQASYVSSTNIQSYLNNRCLRHGSTLDGRKKAFQYQTNCKKLTPIQVSHNEIYFPTLNTRDPNCHWVCFQEIDHIEYKEKTCTIFFKDYTCLQCSHPNRIRKLTTLIWRRLRYSQPLQD